MIRPIMKTSQLFGIVLRSWFGKNIMRNRFTKDKLLTPACGDAITEVFWYLCQYLG